MAKSVVIITSFNRPRLVRDCIESILGQDTADLRLLVMDDGSNDETRAAIRATIDAHEVLTIGAAEMLDHGQDAHSPDKFQAWRVCAPAGVIHVGVAWLPPRPMAERKASISYSRSINFALNFFLRDERYVCYWPDDDFAYPESVRSRADFLDAHPEVHVCYGRSRSIQYAPDGFNTWTGSAPPQAGMAFPRPTGKRVIRESGGPLCYFDDPNERDPQTGREWVEEGWWAPGFFTYGDPNKADHSQIYHRLECFKTCRPWPQKADGTFEYWGEDLRWGVGDGALFTMLGEVHQFYGVRCWSTTKRFHSMNDNRDAGWERE